MVFVTIVLLEGIVAVEKLVALRAGVIVLLHVLL